MTRFLFKELHGSKLSCASPASTAVCASVDHRSISRSSLYKPSKTRQQVRPIPQAGNNRQNLQRQNTRKRWGKPDQDQISPQSAFSRWLLSKDATSDALACWKLSETDRRDEQVATMTSASKKSPYQVVVLQVSIYCKGCERKVRKHLSKMKGVASFNVDLATKKVTVIGDVTPLEVLKSVSKVKNAQFWQSPPLHSTASF